MSAVDMPVDQPPAEIAPDPAPQERLGGGGRKAEKPAKDKPGEVTANVGGGGR